MKIHRSRRALRLAMIVLLGIGLLGCGGAPQRTLTLLAPAAPGGGWDQTAREMQRVLRESGLARTVQVMNVPGAGGTVGLAQLVNTHRGDGDLLMVNGLIMVGSVLTNHAPVTLEQTTPIARLLGEYELLVVPASSPHRTLADLIQAWKANPGQVAIAGGSAGGTDHMLAGLLAKAVGIDVTKVNYVPHSGGGESLASLLGGHVAAGINGSGELISFVQAGQLRPLAISSEERVPGWDIPTFVEQGVDVTLSNWRSVAAAPGITSEQRAAWVELMDGMRQSQAWKDTLQKNNWTDMYLAGPAFEEFLKREDARVEEVLKSIGLVKQ
ncbi:MAG: Bug family tripartite tricarboxylate transporter substrate binding protein [Terriglobia bacterium]